MHDPDEQEERLDTPEDVGDPPPGFVPHAGYPEFARALDLPDLRRPPLEHVLATERLLDGDLVLAFGVYTGLQVRQVATRFPTSRIIWFDAFVRPWADWDLPDMSSAWNRPPWPANARIVRGWLDDTLPAFCRQHAGQRVRLILASCDVYTSSRSVLWDLHAAGMLDAAPCLVLDELIDYPVVLKHERLALHEFLQDHPAYRLEPLGTHGVYRRHPTHDNGYPIRPIALRLIHDLQRRG